MTIISAPFAERCNLVEQLDDRFGGVARGVGTQRILGRIHLGQIQIGDSYLPQNFSVIKEMQTDLLIGLDILRRHECTIDLKVRFSLVRNKKT